MEIAKWVNRRLEGNFARLNSLHQRYGLPPTELLSIWPANEMRPFSPNLSRQTASPLYASLRPYSPAFSHASFRATSPLSGRATPSSLSGTGPTMHLLPPGIVLINPFTDARLADSLLLFDLLETIRPGLIDFSVVAFDNTTKASDPVAWAAKLWCCA
ncbi:unnamed protein product [Protopolystoma xenopodis]|uniref:Uncharacterized protein n=1 Tax=Protopolystoma xenopodis TaxID=117903 RepID=A0A3S5CDZ2_9PLAT|nr:unnamed protein product [Protopolystoma xenopodis]